MSTWAPRAGSCRHRHLGSEGRKEGGAQNSNRTRYSRLPSPHRPAGKVGGSRACAAAKLEARPGSEISPQPAGRTARAPPRGGGGMASLVPGAAALAPAAPGAARSKKRPASPGNGSGPSKKKKVPATVNGPQLASHQSSAGLASHNIQKPNPAQNVAVM
nr:INO80 complex subunit C isoform X5 [Caretta caretta]